MAGWEELVGYIQGIKDSLEVITDEKIKERLLEKQEDAEKRLEVLRKKRVFH